MKNKFYMKELKYFDGESYITFNIVELNKEKQEVYVAVTKQGKISITNYPLIKDKNWWYFEYGPSNEKIFVNEFKEING